MYWINLALTRMGFWITWALVPIVVEIIPAIMSTIKLMRLHRHMPRLKAPAKWPWVTIIVPVYNSEDTLFDCIRSIDHQTYDKKLSEGAASLYPRNHDMKQPPSQL
nr:hypothetical protein [Lactiplantibacillus plantarum]